MSTKFQKEIKAAQQIQYDQKNRHAEILIGWNGVNLMDSKTRRAILAAKNNGTLDKWEVEHFVATGNDGKNAAPVFLPDQTQSTNLDSYFIDIKGERIRIGGESQWPPGALERFCRNLKKSPVSATAQPSVAPELSMSERAVSVGEAPHASKSQEKSVLPLLSKSPTGSTVREKASSVQAPSSSATQEKSVSRVYPDPPKEKTVDENGFEAVSPEKSASPKKVDAVEQTSRPAPITSSPAPKSYAEVVQSSSNETSVNITKTKSNDHSNSNNAKPAVPVAAKLSVTSKLPEPERTVSVKKRASQKKSEPPSKVEALKKDSCLATIALSSPALSSKPEMALKKQEKKVESSRKVFSPALTPHRNDQPSSSSAPPPPTESTPSSSNSETMKQENNSRPGSSSSPVGGQPSSSNSRSKKKEKKKDKKKDKKNDKKKDKKKNKTSISEESDDALLDRLIAENTQMREQMLSERNAQQAQVNVPAEAVSETVANTSEPVANASEPVARSNAPIPDTLKTALIRQKIFQLENKGSTSNHHMKHMTWQTDTLEDALYLQEQINSVVGFKSFVTSGPEEKHQKIAGSEEVKKPTEDHKNE